MPYHHGNLRQVLLEEAAEAIREDGVGRLSLRSLARRAGVSHGAPARHFSDKAALLTALATDALERFQAALLGGMAEAGDSALDRHRAIGVGYVRFAVEHPAYFRLITSRRDFFEPDAEFDAAYQRLYETIREATIAAQQEGWATGRDPDDLLLAAWSVVHGFASLWVEGNVEDYFGSGDPEVAASAVIDILYAASAGEVQSRSRDEGDQTMNEDVYPRLREFMDTLPGGYPATESGVEIKLLKKLFTPEQAELTMKLGREPEEVQSIATRIGMDETKLSERLEELALKGCIFRVREGEKRLYQAYQFVVGVYEFQLNTLDREFAELFEEYLPHLGLSMAQAKTSQMRVIPLESSVEATPAVETYNRIRDLVRQQEIISVEPCICRKEQGLLGNECEKPKEVCIGLGDFAQFYIDNGLGRQISVDEALNVLDTAEEAGLVACPTNSQKIEAICCCCPCCCPILRFAKTMPRPGDEVTSYYEAKLDSEECVDCGLCVERCQMDAIEEDAGVWEIVDGRCIGCGLCVAECPVDAISMVAKPGTEPPPTTFNETLNRIGDERGLQ